MARRNQGKGKKGGGNRGGGNRSGGGGGSKPAAQSGSGGGGRSQPASSRSPQPAQAKAQNQLTSQIQNLKRKARADRKAGNTAGAYDKQTRIGNKQIKRARNQVASAQAAGNTKRASRFENRLGNLKTKRNNRRTKSFNSQNPNSAADFDFSKHSTKKVGVRELAHLKRNEGFSREDITAAANNSGLKIGKRAQKRLDRWASAKDKANGTPVPEASQPNVIEEQTIVAPTFPQPSPTQTITTSPSPSPSPYTPIKVVDPLPNPYVTPNPTVSPNPTIVTPQPNVIPTQPNPYVTDIDDSFNDFDDSFNNNNDQDVDYTQTLNVNQDNDINNTVTGDGNYINNQQDNSIRNYGGDQRVFNYQSNGYGGTGRGVDSPASAATMAGFYSPSDSHAANAARLDRRITQGNDYAKNNMNTSNIAQGSMMMARNNRSIDPAIMDKRVQERGAASKAQAYMMGNSIYGDLASFNPQWTQTQSRKPTQMPNFG
jgi:hypothetical protein